jgi:hypothetical protein
LQYQKVTMDGRCQCGNITFKTPIPEPLEVYICHCTQCRHQSSSAFGISAIFPAFEIESPRPGAISTFSRQTLSGKQLDCLFCSQCGSRLIHKNEGGETVRVKGGCLDGLSLKGAIHIWCKEAITEIPSGSRAFDEQPPDDVRDISKD